MTHSLFILALLTISSVSGSQQESCGYGTKAISSPWLFSQTDDTSCSDLMSSVPDYTNETYLSECQRQLGTPKPKKVDQVNITDCYELENGTIKTLKYKATICCPVPYSLGEWGEWMCTSDQSQARERKCYSVSDNRTVDDSHCSGTSQEVQEVHADCLKCDGVQNGRAYLPHECDEEAYWVCAWTEDDSWNATKMQCGACTKWSQDALTCIHSDEPCVIPGGDTTDDYGDQVTRRVPTNETVDVDKAACSFPDGSVYRSISNKPNSYLWILQNGREFETPCAPGTTFDIVSCKCVLAQANTLKPAAAAATETITCLDFNSLNRWGFSASKGKWVSNFGPVTGKENCGVNGSCAHFNGLSHLEISHFKQSSSGNQLSPFSISLWFKKEESVSDVEYLIRYGYCDEGDSIVMRVESDTSVGAGIRTSSEPHLDAFTGVDVTAKQWHHLVMVFDSTSSALKFYVDGSLKATKTSINGVLQYKNCPMVIGRLFKGYMDEVCFHKAALSQTTIMSLYNGKE